MAFEASNPTHPTYKNSRILFSFFSGGLRHPHPPNKSAFGLPSRVRNSWYHGTMVPWYHGSVRGRHGTNGTHGTRGGMVPGYHGTNGMGVSWDGAAFDTICLFCDFYKDGSVRIPDGK